MFCDCGALAVCCCFFFLSTNKVFANVRSVENEHLALMVCYDTNKGAVLSVRIVSNPVSNATHFSTSLECVTAEVDAQFLSWYFLGVARIWGKSYRL